VTEVHAAIQQLEEEPFPVSLLCESLNVSRSAYHAWRDDRVSTRRQEDNLLRPVIRGIFWEHRRRYGARRIAADLADRHQPCGRRRVGRLMHEMGLVAIQPKSFKPRTTDSRHGLGYSPNLLLDAPPPDGINRLWVGDITYVPLVGSDFLYLAMLMDRLSRRNHTDRGGQYAGAEYRKLLARAGMPQSMSRAGNCYDNAFMESCFGTLKTELEMEPYPNQHVARKEIPDYIRYYNTRRRHSALGYLTPEAYEAMIS